MSPISGGGNLKDLRPADPDPNTRIRGNHKRSSAALNVVNPQPGFHYYWGRRGHDDLLRLVNEGWQVVHPDAPEHKGREDSSFGQALDGYSVRQDVVLLRIPVDQYRELRKEKAELAQAQISGTVDAFLQKGDSVPERYRESADGPVYYRSPGHKVYSE